MQILKMSMACFLAAKFLEKITMMSKKHFLITMQIYRNFLKTFRRNIASPKTPSLKNIYTFLDWPIHADFANVLYFFC